MTDSAFTPTRSDTFKYHRCTANGDINGEIVIQIAPDTFQPSDEIHFRHAGNGIISIVAMSGVTINSMFGHTNRSFGNGAVLTLKFVTANEVDLFGALELL